QDRVDESGAVVADDPAGQVDGAADRGVRGDVHGQQLVGAHAQQGEDFGVDGAQGAVHAGVQDSVVGALEAQSPVGQLGGEPGVPSGDPPFAEEDGQQQVGVGVAGLDCVQHVVGDAAGRVPGAGPRRGTARAAPGRAVRG